MTTATPTTATPTTATSTTTAATRATRGRPFGRPMLYTAYGQEMALFNTLTKKVMVGLLLVLAAVAPFGLVDKDLKLLATACVTAIGAIGLGLVTGYAGQVSLGHAFFLAVGAYTAAVISGNPEGRTLGFGVQEILIWLPAAGIVAALAGVIVAPLATRLRGLYLAIVTLGLVFIGEYVLREWSEVTGGTGIGRPAPTPALFGQRLDVSTPIFDGYVLTRDQKLYWLMLVLLVIFALAARNIARSRVGRAFTAIRDRDIAAGVMGVNLARYKTIAFAVSSFYAGCAGALLYVSVWLLRARLVQPGDVGPVHRDGAHRRGRHHLRGDPGRVLLHLPAHPDPADSLRCHQRSCHRHPEHLPTAAGALRRTHHRVPPLRAPRSVRPLDSSSQFLEGLAIQVLIRRKGMNLHHPSQPPHQNS